MRSPSLLSKYLLITAATCAAAVALTGLSLYVAFRSSMATVLSQSTLVFQDQMAAQLEEHARSTTRALAARCATLMRGKVPEDLTDTLQRAAELDGAELIVLIDATGRVTHQTGDSALLAQLEGVAPGQVTARGGFIVARMALDGDISGSIKLRGRVSGERFEQTYPVKIVPTTSSGNAFVPRLFAAAKIAELERTGGELAKPMIIELSKRFAVASQFTSLIVLESQAMFNAFGLDRGSVAPLFTGEVAASSQSADAESEPDAPADDALGAAAEEKEKGSASGPAKAATSPPPSATASITAATAPQAHEPV